MRVLGSPWSLRSARRDGVERWLIGRGRCHYDGAGKPVRLVGASIDITGPKLAVDEAEKVRRTLQDLLDQAPIEHFAVIATHDLQEPLRMIASYLGLLQRKHASHLDARANEYIG